MELSTTHEVYRRKAAIYLDENRAVVENKIKWVWELRHFKGFDNPIWQPAQDRFFKTLARKHDGVLGPYKTKKKGVFKKELD